jgi:hypothetical protein
MHLTSIGYIPGKPEGNRLRWSYPTQSLYKRNSFLGLPEKIIIERAPIQDVKYQTQLSTSSVIPLSWWDDHGSINLTGFPILIHKLPSSVQAASFIYKGPKTRLIVMDSENNKIVVYRNLDNGDAVHLQTSNMDTFLFLAFHKIELQDLKTLDLFKDRGLKWEPIAIISVREAFKANYKEVIQRYDAPVTLLKEQWADLADIAMKAQLSTPAGPIKHKLELWKNLDMMIGLRWEFAVISGYGFFDGPHSKTSPLDNIYSDKLLKGIPPQAYAYRVREKDGRRGVKPSNIVICPNWLIAPLIAPSIPSIVSPEVRLNAKGIFEATYSMTWNHFDPCALGVEIEEEISPSVSVNSSLIKDTFESRSHRPEEAPMQGKIARSLNVPFHDVKIRSHIRATDGWDRISTYSSWTPFTPLELHHNPPAPPLESARYDAGTVHIFRQIDNSLLPDWSPDIIVEKALGKVYIYRKDLNKNPRVVDVNVSAPILVEGDLFRMDLPREIVFTAPIPEPTNEADVLSYYARLSYLDKQGPTSNIVQAIRVPPTPIVPPPFTVELLGIDFYMRTMVKIIFTDHVSEGLFSVWWADGAFEIDQFGSQAVPGEYRAQQVQNQQFLYDVLSLPIPNNANRVVTIGVQRVNTGGGQSNFLSVQITLIANPHELDE